MRSLSLVHMRISPLVFLLVLLLAPIARGFLLGDDITEEGKGKIYTVEVTVPAKDHPNRLVFTLRVNEQQLLQRYKKEELTWGYSDVEGWNKNAEESGFQFNFPIAFKSQEDGWYEATFEMSTELARNSQVTLYCVSKVSSFEANAHIKLSAYVPTP